MIQSIAKVRGSLLKPIVALLHFIQSVVDSSRLLDVDLSWLRSLSLGDQDAQDTVLEAGLDSVLVNSGREGEGTVELSNGALADPVFRLAGVFLLLGNTLLLGLLGDLVARLGWIVLNGGLVAELLLFGVLAILDETLWALALFTHMLVAAGDGEGVVVGPLNVDVLLLDPGKFAL